jgi:hypothetical protein
MVMKFETNEFKKCLTPCAIVKSYYIGAIACIYCDNFTSIDRKLKTVTCKGDSYENIFQKNS